MAVCDWSGLTMFMRQAQYLCVTSMRQMWKGVLAAFLAATMTFAFIPSTHAHASSGHASNAMAVQLDDMGDNHTAPHSHHAAPKMDQPVDQLTQHAPSAPDSELCCDDAGLCAGGFTLAIETTSIEPLFSANDEWPANGNAFIDFTPALDIPPPRHS